MKTVAVLWRRMAGMFGRTRGDMDLVAEIESHIELHTSDNIRAGMTAEEARREARLHFGSMEAVKDEYRARRGVPALETIVQDVRFAAHTLRNRPGFTVVAILTLALGIGGATAIFSVLKAVILQPLPYSDPERLYLIHEVVPQLRDRYPLLPVNASHYKTWIESMEQPATLAAFDYQALTLTGAREAEQVGCARVTASMFEVLGVDPAIGRSFTAEDEREGPEDVVLLSYGFWQRRYARDPAIVGKRILLDGRSYTILGVMPQSFRFPTIDEVNPIRREIPKPEIIRPLIFTPRELRPQSGSFNFFAIVRLVPGLSREQATAKLNAIQAGIAKSNPAGFSLEVSLDPLRSYAVRDVRQSLLLLMFAVTAVLILVCANVAHLLLAQGASRQREIAIRAALGAGTSRLLRQLLTETSLLAGAGGVLGILIASFGVDRRQLELPTDDN